MRAGSQMRARMRITLNSLHLRSLVLSAALAAAVVTSGAGPDLAGAHGLLTGFGAPRDGADLDRMVDARAGIVRVTVGWSAVAPQRPAQPANPADPGYRFGYPDSVVENAASKGLAVLITFEGAPSWAEGGNRPRGAAPGSWKPKPGAVRPFAHALAARYSGDFTPVGATSPLPRVRYFEVWNEPNLSSQLAPQWRHGRPASPARYRKMLNAAYAGIKSARRGDRVVGPGTAPYGDPPGGERMRPLIFL